MDDWGKVAAIVALATIPIYASPLLVQPVVRKVRDVAVRMYYRDRRCEAIQWQHLPHGPIKPYSLWHAPSTATSDRGFQAPDKADDNRSPKLTAIARFLRSVWQVNTRPVSRQAYLDVAKEYLRLDADVLLAMVLLDGGSGSPDGHPDPGASCTLRFGSVAAHFRVFESEHGFYMIGSLNAVPHFEPVKLGYHGITKDDLRAIGAGYPPFYRHFLSANSGAEVAHPIQSMRDIHRAGWILAIGLSTTPPLELYDHRRLAAYSEACDRVLQTLQRLGKEYASEPTRKALLDVAVKVVTRMNSYRTGSGAGSLTAGTVLLNGDSATIGRGMSVPQIIFALKFFNDYRDEGLRDDERERFDDILEEVLRAAVLGVFEWWQYVNNRGRRVPGWLLDESVRLTPIWLEDGGDGPDG